MDKFRNEQLDKYATTDAERALFRALSDCGGDYAAMAVALGVDQARIRGRLHRLRKKAALRGWSPTHDVKHPTPEGFHVKGTSTLYDADGKVSIQWVKTDKDREQLLEDMRTAVEELCEPLRGKMKAVRRPTVDASGKDMMALYAIGDHHLGMFAWAEECGADYDLKIAESVLDRAFDKLVAKTPPAEKALIVNIGDFFHADNSSGVTPRGGNNLDTDSRHSKVIQVGIRMMRRQIRLALTKHAEVEVLTLSGNHDPESSVWLAHCLAAAFDAEPRVTIRTDPRIYKYTKWGTNLIMTTHGHTCKPKDLPSIMACDVPEWWGECRHREAIHGHIHHLQEKEERGCLVRSIKVLAESDSWHHGQGYRSRRGMEMSIYHKTQGKILTLPGPIEYLLAE